MSVGTSRAARSIIASLLIVATAPAHAQPAAWLALPAWQQPFDTVKATEGESAVTHEARPGSQLASFDFRLSAPAQAGKVSASREYYFDAAGALALIRIVPVKTDPANCDALLAETMLVLGKQDEQPRAGAIPLELLDNRYWFRAKEDRLYNWSQFKSLRGAVANTPCSLIIEPYKAGMKRKAAR